MKNKPLLPDLQFKLFEPEFVNYVSVTSTLTIQEQLMPFTSMGMERMVRDHMGIKCGFFKLESNRDMSPEGALRLYCRRVGVEHLISSLKRITDIKPIRVWNEDSVGGSMVLALLSEAAMVVARSYMDSEKVTRKDEDGNEHERTVKPSTESNVNALTHLTLTIYMGDKRPYKVITSNWNPNPRRSWGR